MGLTRKQFLQGAAGGTVVLLIQSCGGGGGGYAGGQAGMTNGGYNGTVQPMSCGADAISNNHGHALAIAISDLDSTTDKVYSLSLIHI